MHSDCSLSYFFMWLLNSHQQGTSTLGRFYTSANRISYLKLPGRLSWANGEVTIHWDMIQLSINVHWTQSVYWTMTAYPQQLNLLFKRKWEKYVSPWILNLILNSSIWSKFMSNSRKYFSKEELNVSLRMTTCLNQHTYAGLLVHIMYPTLC